MTQIILYNNIINSKIIGSNLEYYIGEDDWIDLKFNLSKIAKASSISGKSRVISTIHNNYRPFSEYPKLEFRFTIYIFKNSEINYIEDSRLFNVWRPLGDNLFYIYRSPKIIEIKFNPKVTLGPSNKGTSTLIAQSSNKFHFLNKNVQFKISVFRY